ncbi:MAG: TolC family protein [Spirochaetia bacterium]|nr:TolC family protein [Spirochaetia bacterium]
MRFSHLKFNGKCRFLIFSAALFFCPVEAFGQNHAEEDQHSQEETIGYSKLPVGKDGKPSRLTLEEIVQLVLENNTMVRIQKLELVKSDTELMKDESKYAPILGMGYQGSQRKDKPLPSSVFSGTKTYTDRYYANISKLFSSGTYFQLEVSDTRFDSNAGESFLAQSSFAGSLAQPPLHTGALTVVLRQELLKNSFGYNQRRMNEISRNNALMRKHDVSFQLGQLIVQAMVEYWQLAIADENLETSRVLLDNTKNIRNITIRKRGIGLAETFEINQWNAIVANSEIRLDSAEMERDMRKRNLLRTLNLDPESEIDGSSQLLEKIPGDIDLKKDINHALQTRPDYKNIKLQKANAEKLHELAKNNLLPSVTIGGKYSSRGYGRHANSSSIPDEVSDGRYPESSVEFRVEYPLWDKGAKADSRNAEIALKQMDIQEREMRRRIEDDVRESMDRIHTSHTALVKTKEALKQTEAFYRGLLVRYTQGRFNAETVKNALDALVQARLSYMQAKINFNISLVRYDLARNTIFKKYNIDIDKIIESQN